MKKIISTSLVFVVAVVLTSCASDAQKQLQQLQQTQTQLNQDASQNLANIEAYKAKIVSYRQEADTLQKQSNAMVTDINDLKAAYSQFKDPNNSSAIAVNKELVQKTLEKVQLDEKINKYRSQANEYQTKIDDLKVTSQTQANESAKISQQINQLKTISK
ncbi:MULTISPECIES: hypothetical protein [unclassified Francisella]|uniref:hypothetical protein n=1 Tax=unclassified Francisella TaxID=2610885 RepID=UPI002E2ED6D5|nr:MULTISPECIES: hypothetical protein [unclassified Francisella]MED7818678.1 hypothetical protein [Francisella sp. 19S2-4]MED7829605.1 hypothetical protein [Francisella sp. 19S2-10]